MKVITILLSNNISFSSHFINSNSFFITLAPKFLKKGWIFFGTRLLHIYFCVKIWHVEFYNFSGNSLQNPTKRAKNAFTPRWSSARQDTERGLLRRINKKDLALWHRIRYDTIVLQYFHLEQWKSIGNF